MGGGLLEHHCSRTDDSCHPAVIHYRSSLFSYFYVPYNPAVTYLPPLPSRRSSLALQRMLSALLT